MEVEGTKPRGSYLRKIMVGWYQERYKKRFGQSQKMAIKPMCVFESVFKA